jgi:hypothetical protein
MQCREGLCCLYTLSAGQFIGPGLGNPLAWSGYVAAESVDAVGCGADINRLYLSNNNYKLFFKTNINKIQGIKYLKL